MTMTSIGDLSQAFLNRQHNFDLRSRLNQLAQELSTGHVSDPSSYLSGDFTRLGSVDQAIARNNSYLQNMSQQAALFDHVQISLGSIQERVLQFEIAARNIDLDQQLSAIARIGQDAENAFAAIVAELNGTSLGQNVFSGRATEQQSINNSDAILQDLSLATAGMTDAANIRAAVDLWFDAGGGFDATGYLGSQSAQSAIVVGPNAKVDPLPRADADAIRQSLKGMALIALTNQSGNALDQSAKMALIGGATEPLGQATVGLIDMAASVGNSQERIAQETSRMNAQNTSMGIYRNEMVSADPFETASNLEQVQLQLETHYTVTARLSRLSLVEYLR